MEDRKRPAVGTNDDMAPPTKRQAVNGGGRAKDDAGDSKEEAWIEVGRAHTTQSIPPAASCFSAKEPPRLPECPCCSPKDYLRRCYSPTSVLSVSFMARPGTVPVDPRSYALLLLLLLDSPHCREKKDCTWHTMPLYASHKDVA